MNLFPDSLPAAATHFAPVSSPGTTAPPSFSFHGFLAELGKSRLQTGDLVAAVRPLIEQTLEAHDRDRVGPFKGIAAIQVTHGRLWYREEDLRPPSRNQALLDAIQPAGPRSVEIVEVRSGKENQLIIAPHDQVRFPSYVTDYFCWEHLIEHHDPLTDIYSIGLLLASLSLQQDFGDRRVFTRFVENRANLFELRQDLHPAIQKIILKTTEANRHRRVQDLESVHEFLKNFRGRPLISIGATEPKKGALENKRTAILQNLRNRLFDTSRRNKLIYFEPHAQALNLTEASVPSLLAHQNLDPLQLFMWQPELERRFREGRRIKLNRYFQSETSPEATASLTRIRQAANRDEKEFGFSNLRLAIAFLHWHNLRDAATRDQPIHSPLLLLPVRLHAERGVKDSFELEPVGTEAEVNPALRHYLKLLYELNLPERIDLTQTSPADFLEGLRSQIEASAPEVTLESIDRPQIRLWRDRVRYTATRDARPHRLCGEHVKTVLDIDYSYRTDQPVPLGLRLFETYVRPATLPVDYAHYDRERYETVGLGQGNNPWRWMFDLCHMTLGNFDFQKMTLVHDYDALIGRPDPHGSFEALFATAPLPPGKTPPALPLKDQYLIAPADPTQVSAIAWARTGRDMIIQGPPGTGKSQTITNLIADYVARGKRVLFVCEKRAALDVVYSRLGKARLDRQSVLIHDTQGDRTGFVKDLREAYESLQRGTSAPNGDAEARRLVKTIVPVLGHLERYCRGLQTPLGEAPFNVLELLERLIELRRFDSGLAVEEQEKLPGYGVWHNYGDRVREVGDALRELGLRRAFGGSPLRVLSRPCLHGEIPVSVIREELTRREGAVRQLVDLVTGLSFDLTGVPLRELPPLIDLASQAHYFVLHDLMGLLREDSFESRRLAELDEALEEVTLKLAQNAAGTEHWLARLARADLDPALTTARFLGQLQCPQLSRKYWKLRAVLHRRYDFKAHAVPPRWEPILGHLDQEYRLQDDREALEEQLRHEFRVKDGEALRRSVKTFRQLQHALPDSLRVRELLHFLSTQANARDVVTGLHLAGQNLEQLDGLERWIPGYRDMSAVALGQAHAEALEHLHQLPDLSPSFRALGTTPPAFYEVLRQLDLEPEGLEAAMGRKTLKGLLRADRDLKSLDGPAYRRYSEELAEAYAGWIENNGARIAARARHEAVSAYALSNRPDDQLRQAERERKQVLQQARSLLEHQFRLKHRFKSIREIATGSRSLLMDLKPVWLMSPLSISQTLPLEPDLFDVVIFDEASQVKLEDAIPSIFRGKQVIVVGDEMQLPPTNFFSANALEGEDVVCYRDGDQPQAYDLAADSLLSHAARRLPSTLLGWHYRSRHEALISFSNHAFYGGDLLTIPDRRAVVESRNPIVVRDVDEVSAGLKAALNRSISFHHVPDGTYDRRRNQDEAAYIAGLVRDFLRGQRDLEPEQRQSLGVVAFSDAQQEEIERALERVARHDPEFDRLLATERERVAEGEFVGLFVKNLENVQGDERDVIILSVCYAPGPDGRMKMNFGPINQAGGEKRLNVILSRARQHMMVVSSITHKAITNDWNDGARCLKQFLEYAEAVSRGDRAGAERVLAAVLPSSGEDEADSQAPLSPTSHSLARSLVEKGYEVCTGIGDSGFKIDIALRRPGSPDFELAILLDGQGWSEGEPGVLERAVLRPGILRAFGWDVVHVLSKDWFEDPDRVLAHVEAVMGGAVGMIPAAEQRA